LPVSLIEDIAESTDLTPMEREQRRKLVKELKDRRENGELDLILVGDKIVKRRAY